MRPHVVSPHVVRPHVVSPHVVSPHVVRHMLCVCVQLGSNLCLKVYVWINIISLH